MAKAKTPKQYKADVRRAARGFKGAATTARRIGYNVEAMRALRTIAAENNARNFATNGSAMGDNWEGAKTGNAILDDAVATGALKALMTKPYELKPRVADLFQHSAAPHSLHSVLGSASLWVDPAERWEHR